MVKKKRIKSDATDLPVSETIAEIRELLAADGAMGIAFDSDGQDTRKALFVRIRDEGKERTHR